MKFNNNNNNPVTIKGWLYKRGNDGLKLWKKRYFVLADYCLSYYKSPHDDKASGSVMLPSYRISPVCKDDGIPRKFAFKAEHQNMRTYYFAADSQTNMVQWMNSMSLAAILQAEKSFARPKKMVNGNNNNITAYRNSKHFAADSNSSPNFHNYPPAVHKMHGAHEQAYAFPPAPVYVNAPPKPQRVSTTTIMVTGQYHQPLSSGDVQQAHQRWIPGPPGPGAAFFPPPPQNQQQPRSRPTPRDFSRSLGRAAGAHFSSPQENPYSFGGTGSVGRHGGAIMAPRTPMMGRQIKVRRQLQQQQYFQHQQLPRPKSR